MPGRKSVVAIAFKLKPFRIENGEKQDYTAVL
jgi:hypothetical protein